MKVKYKIVIVPCYFLEDKTIPFANLMKKDEIMKENINLLLLNAFFFNE